MTLEDLSGHLPRKARVLIGFFLLLVTGAGYIFYIFVINSDFNEVVPGLVYRSAQPSPKRLREWISRYSLKTVVNLRGSKAPMARQEQALCSEMACSIIYIELSAYKHITRKKLLHLIEVFETSDKPMLVHCRNGVDRSGTAGALAAWFLGGESYNHAKWHAYVPPGPWNWRNGSYHISDLFADYKCFCKGQKFNFDDFNRFKQWAATIYQSPASCNVRQDM